MRIQSKDLPQADRIESVIAVAVAVANGAHADIEIANQIPEIHGDDRQGRYYRRAAEMLGFIHNANNNAVITPRGQLIAGNPQLNNPELLQAVLNLNVYQKLLPYFELHPQGLTRNEIITYIGEISEGLSLETIKRRFSTVITWIRVMGVITLNGENYQLSNAIIPAIPKIELNDIEQPILPATGNLQEYQTVEERVSSAKEIITIYKNQAKLERASNAHIQLVNLVAERIKQAGGIPKSNQFIDLATSLNQDFIFEMKSTNENNVKAQVRKGISQLYEYRYIQNKPDAKLALVIENPLTGDNSWMLDYVENDRDIHLIWDGDGNLYGTEATKGELGFLNLL